MQKGGGGNYALLTAAGSLATTNSHNRRKPCDRLVFERLKHECITMDLWVLLQGCCDPEGFLREAATLIFSGDCLGEFPSAAAHGCR